MPKVTFVDVDGHRTPVDARLGDSLMRAATENGVTGIVADCGGACSCATCHVYLEAGWASRLPAPGPMESEMLEFTAAGRRPGSRLSCQLIASPELDGLELHLPVRQVVG